MPLPAAFCVDDLTRDDHVPLHECLYDLVRAPIWHAAGLDIARAPRAGQRHALAPTFQPEAFRDACGLPQRHWSAVHHRLPPEAAGMLRAALPAQGLALGHAMPPWLRELLDDAGCAWLDLRISPLAFGADAYVELRTNDADLAAAAAPFGLGAEALFTEACLQMASVRRARRAAPGGTRWDDALVFVPQAGETPVLLGTDGRFVQLEDFAGALRDLDAQRRIVCLSGDEPQRQRLSRLLGRTVGCCDEALDLLLTMDDDVAFVGLQVPALQQAAYVGKQALQLCSPPPLPDPVVLPAHEFLSEPLWAALLTGAPPRPGAVRVPPRADDLRHRLGLRPHEPSAVAATASAEARPEPLPEGLDLLEIERQRVDALRLEVDGLKDALRLLMRQAAMADALRAVPEPA